MNNKLRFYKENERWYADIPNVSKEDNEMVFGADTFLEKVSNGKTQIEIEFTIDYPGNFIYGFSLIDHDEYGATYQSKINKEETIWLCNVAHEIFIEHPMEIFITDIKIDELYEGRRCQYKDTDQYYTIVGKGLMKMEDGLWYDSVVYRGENKYLVNKPMTIFTKKMSDFIKEFNLL